MAEAIRTSKDRRVGYVIYNSRIFSGPAGKQPFVWRKYTGANAHTKHVHIDVIDQHQDDTTRPGRSRLLSVRRRSPSRRRR